MSERMSLLRALRSRRYAYLWIAQLVSSLGDWLYRIALVWWVLAETGSGQAMGVVAILTIVPQLALLLFGGVIVDRIPRIVVMIGSDVSRAALTGGLAVLTATDHLTIGVVYAVSIVFGIVDAFVGPAFNAIMPELVATDDLPSANALNTLSTQLTGIVGPALGGLLVAGGGTAIAFGIDAVSFVGSAVALLAAGPSARPAPFADFEGDDNPKVATVTVRVGATGVMLPEPPKTSVFRDMREGLATVRSEPWLWVTIVCIDPALTVYAALTSVALPFLVKITLGRGVGALSVVQGAAAIGAVIGAVVLGRRGRLPRRGLVMYGSVVAMGLCMVAMGTIPTVVGVAAAALVCSLAMSTLNLVWLESVQSTIPGEKLGRVWSIDALAALVPMPIGMYVAGWSVDHGPPTIAFVAGGLGVAVLALLGLLHTRIRRFD